jgi:hypothetical protein
VKTEIKKQWVEALRSGNYVQGKHRLHQDIEGDQEFCCLGVLCDLAVQAGVKVERSKGQDADEDDVYYYDNQMDLLPDSVMQWADMDTRGGDFVMEDPDEEGPHGLPRYLESTLAEENDRGRTFEDLAALIEELF